MRLKDILTPFRAWSNITIEPVTVKNPLTERPGAARYRGFHKNDINTCIGCGTCEEICENKAIDMVPVEGLEPKNGDSGLRPLVDYGRCCWCALCVDVCTTGSLTMSNEYIWVDNDPEVFKYVPGVDKKDWDNSEKGWKKPDYELLNLERVNVVEEEPEKRIKSFIEIVKVYSKEQAEKEADRCVECGICVATCPAHMDIPGYIKAIREGNLEEGLKLLYETNPMPSTCGRVCTHRCEEVCAIGHKGDAVAIRWLKRYIADNVPFEKYKEILGLDTVPERNYKISIIGAGPSGISAAYYLRTMGYQVTIYEAKSHAGGMTMYGIPKYRLPQDVLEKEVKLLTDMGIKINFNTHVGKDISFDEIYNNSDAVFMGIGFEVPYKIAIKGEDADGSIQAIDYLNKINSGKQVDIGNKVVVIGGGNVAMDAARTSRRSGAEVTILYRRRIEDMPADPEEIHGAIEEGVNIIPQTIPVEIIIENNKVTGIKYLMARMEDDPKGGRPRPVPIEGSEKSIEATAVIGAIGQEADFSLMAEEWLNKLEISRGRIVTNNLRQTSIPKLFAGGDSVNKTADAISAIADGYKAAKGIDEYISSLNNK